MLCLYAAVLRYYNLADIVSSSRHLLAWLALWVWFHVRIIPTPRSIWNMVSLCLSERKQKHSSFPLLRCWEYGFNLFIRNKKIIACSTFHDGAVIFWHVMLASIFFIDQSTLLWVMLSMLHLPLSLSLTLFWYPIWIGSTWYPKSVYFFSILIGCKMEAMITWLTGECASR